MIANFSVSSGPTAGGSSSPATNRVTRTDVPSNVDTASSVASRSAG